MIKNTVIFLAITGIILRIIFSFLIPDFTGNDEQAHLRYAQHILAEKKLPNLNNYQDENPAGNEYFQPPLYYLLLTPLISLTDNYSHQLHSARFVSILIWLVGFYFAFKLISIIKLREPHNTLILIFLAFLPTYIASSSTVNNDTLTITLSIITFFCIAKLLNQQLTSIKLLGPSILISLAILTKITGLIFLPAIIWLIYYKSKGINRKFISATTFFLVSTSILTSWWFIYNFLTYQNFLGPIAASTATFTNVPLSAYKLYLVIRGTFFTFWAAWGSANQIRLPLYTYLILLVLTVLPIFGFFLFIRKVFRKKANLPINKKYIYIFMIVLNTNIFLLLAFNIHQHQPLGRYLYPSLFSVALFWSIGLNHFLPKGTYKHLPKLIIIIMLYLNLLGIIALTNYYK